MRALPFSFQNSKISCTCFLKTTLVLLASLLSKVRLSEPTGALFVIMSHECMYHQKFVILRPAGNFTPKERRCINLREQKCIGSKQCKLTFGSVDVWNGVFGIRYDVIPFVYLGSGNSSNSTQLMQLLRGPRMWVCPVYEQRILAAKQL